MASSEDNIDDTGFPLEQYINYDPGFEPGEQGYTEGNATLDQAESSFSS